MIFFLINRFRRKKLRARESRQTAEDQRSIVGSIGYIAGNMGYMEGNLSSMDYTYGGAATHYPLWKPPSGYFPRGEAPPPYDEAVAISQAEALSAQCAAAAAAAQAAATQRATMGMNTVELQNADINRRAQANQQMQQIQHHNQPQTAHSQLNHQTTHIVPTLQAHVMAPPPQQQSSQSHQITQSTTNLINININSGGNITTIATGENHQPPYSLQDDNTGPTGLLQQQSAAMASQQMQMQQQQQQLIATSTNGSNGHNNGRVHIAQSNSICVQTMTPINQQPPPQQQISTQQQQQQTQIVANSNSNTLTRQTQNLVMSSGVNDCGYKNCHLSANNNTNTVSRRVQRSNEPIQQYVVDVEVNVGGGNTRGYHSLPPCNNQSTADLEAIASPTQFSNNSVAVAAAMSSPAIDQVSSSNSSNQTNELNSVASFTADNCSQLNNIGHNTLPIQHNQSNKSSASSTTTVGAIKTSSSSNSSSSSSSKRYHRTMPRYYAIADPLTARENSLNTAGKVNKSEVKLTSNNISSSNNSSANSSLSNSKKPTCQCPVQHVPMSYMGSTQLTNAQNVSNNAFFSVLSNKLNSSASANNSPSTAQQQQQHSQRLQNNSTNTNSLNYQTRPKSSQSMQHSQRDNENISISTNNTMKRSLNAHCNYEPKIATISTGELHNTTTGSQHHGHQGQQQQQQQHQSQQHHHHSHVHGHGHHHGHHSSLLPPPQHQDDSTPIVLGRVTKRSSSSSSGDRLRSASSGSTRSSVAENVAITSPAAAAYLNSKVDAYLNFAHGTSHHLKANDLNNPALPPKLHKSLTNLKSTTATTPSSSAAVNTNNISNSNQRKNNNNNNNDNITTASKTNNTNYSNTTSTITNCNNFSSTSSSSSTSNTNSNSNAVLTMHNTPPLASTTSVQTIYTLSKPHQHSTLTPNGGGGVGIVGSNINNLSPSFNANRKSEHDHIMKITQQQPPSLTLPLATTSTITSFTSSTSKINSSTFYPLQNNVTYTLPKNIGGKMSLNSTINSVVSKVPSVISLPSSSSISTSIANEHLNLNNVSSEGGENHHVFHHSALNYQHQSAAAGVQQGEGSSITSKSTTLPKILRTKRDLHTQNQTSSNSNTTNNHNSSSNHTSNNLNTSSSTNNAAASTNYAVSQCFMPAYPKQYIISNNTTSSSSSSSTSATTAAIQQEQQQPTNINNMQTQTITSTLAANYCPEDSHFNQHHFTTNTTPKTHSSFTSSSSSSVSSNNITTTCNTTTTTMNIATNTTNTTTGSNNAKQLPVCTTSKNCLNPKEHFLPNDTSLDDDYLSECENCKIAQSSKYYLDAEALASGPQATMTLQRKSMEECKEETETGYYRISHTLPTNSKKNAPAKSNNRDQWFSTIPAASSSSEEDLNE